MCLPLAPPSLALGTLHERTKDVQYPDYPHPGLFWLWEVSIGTNPKVFRPRNIMMKSEPGTLTERLRSGIIHVGTGTLSTTYSESWAADEGVPYGHVDQHLNFLTLELTTLAKWYSASHDG